MDPVESVLSGRHNLQPTDQGDFSPNAKEAGKFMGKRRCLKSKYGRTCLAELCLIDGIDPGEHAHAELLRQHAHNRRLAAATTLAASARGSRAAQPIRHYIGPRKRESNAAKR